ncbi:sugar kinase [Paenibacillus nanensis]|uniref:Sugar kinase n=1 Tax=Paenibacillus nanensis TaxID=393251 RepID=A0A3A1USS1_9BACL|nr:PfkB family carbohydrate kinase [Paenibacillus nanensis]RIX50222.1 sugar kinase [Paenibacillus nanensis]
MSQLITVIGNVFMDIKGFASEQYHPQAKNIGQIRFVHGGVGRNIAENLALMGMPSCLVSTVDESALGNEVVRRLQSRGVDTRFMSAYPQGMGMWLATMDEQGNLVGSISQQPDFGGLYGGIANHGHAIAEASSHLALSIDLTEAIARKTIELAASYRKPIYGLPGNMSVIMSHPDILEGLDCFVCNHVEAGRLMAVSFDALSIDGQIEAMAQFVEARGLRSMVITLGAKGSVFYDSLSGVKGHQPVFPVDMVDSSGAGDAFFSGVVAGLAQGIPLNQAVWIGTKVAGWVIESAENNCPNTRTLMASDPFMKEWFNDKKKPV